MDRLARRVAARWAFQQATSGWRPEIPSWVFTKFASREAYVPSPTEVEPSVFDLAKESVNILLPKLLDLLRKKMKERYSLNASQRREEVFYYFATKDPVDSFAMHFSVRNGVVLLDFSYVPFSPVTNRPDYTKVIESRGVAKDPELAGLALMRVVRQVLDQI